MKKDMQNNGRLWTKNFIIINVINLLIFFSFQMLLRTLPIYVKELGGTNSIIGVVTGIFVVSSVIIRLISGLLLDKLGRKKVFVVKKISYKHIRLALRLYTAGLSLIQNI